MSRDLSRSMWGVADIVMRPVVVHLYVVCHSDAGHCPTVGVSREGARLHRGILSTETEILTSRFTIAPQNDRTEGMLCTDFPLVLEMTKGRQPSGLLAERHKKGYASAMMSIFFVLPANTIGYKFVLL